MSSLDVSGREGRTQARKILPAVYPDEEDDDDDDDDDNDRDDGR